MNRRILIQVTTPTVLIGLTLFVASLVGAWHISRLQGHLASILADRSPNALARARRVQAFDLFRR